MYVLDSHRNCYLQLTKTCLYVFSRHSYHPRNSCSSIADEFKGHSLLEGARQADVTRVKKYLSMEIVNFKHPYSGDSALVFIFIIHRLTI